MPRHPYFDLIIEAMKTEDTSAVIDRDHPDWQYWHDEFAHDALLSAAEPPALPTAPKPLAVSLADSAALLSISPDSFERHVLPNICIIQIGRRKIVPLRELEDWIASKSARALRG